MALVVGGDGAEVGVGVANIDSRGIAALDVDRWGSGCSGNRGRDWRTNAPLPKVKGLN
jgi:hypothetical protein